jgi:hypothetical protein
VSSVAKFKKRGLNDSGNIFVQSSGQPSMASIFSASPVVFKIPATRPPIPARQYILPAPSAVSFLAALSAIAPTSAAPEHAKIKVGAAQQTFSSLSPIIFSSLFF